MALSVETSKSTDSLRWLLFIDKPRFRPDFTHFQLEKLAVGSGRNRSGQKQPTIFSSFYRSSYFREIRRSPQDSKTGLQESFRRIIGVGKVADLTVALLLRPSEYLAILLD